MDEDPMHPTSRVYDPGFGFLNKQGRVSVKFETGRGMRRARKVR